MSPAKSSRCPHGGQHCTHSHQCPQAHRPGHCTERHARLRALVADIAEDALELIGAAADAVEDRLEGAGTPRHCDQCEEHRCDQACCLPRRPGKQVGTSRGDIDGSPVTPADLEGDHPSGTWAGDRKELYLPFLFMRANPGDLGGRPVVGPFWESPDIYILAGIAPSMAPPIPPQLGQNALAYEDNTIYAHVWNFGRAAAREVTVEFYWCNPALGFSGASAHLIGQAWTSLGARGSGSAHAVVKCPEAWPATYVNGGHECLLVRAWDVASDHLGTPEWDASLNRHVGQRNIHVMTADEAAGAPPLQLGVGPLFGAPATLQVERTAPNQMPWLQLRAGIRGQFPAAAPATGEAVLSPAGPIGGATPLGTTGEQQPADGDDQQTTFRTTDAPPAPGQAHVYRVSAQQQGAAVGGYTVVILGE
jgi:hypothetical protein